MISNNYEHYLVFIPNNKYLSEEDVKKLYIGFNDVRYKIKLKDFKTLEEAETELVFYNSIRIEKKIGRIANYDYHIHCVVKDNKIIKLSKILNMKA